ncbi:diacylglycerol kinase family lipid kinase [Tuanshanicoccus lijuaniae]|uniref:diacylglycerol/lipid kinase family protein n=1 Tax=Aerococcaceae bacterium zg-1292 TaxID=2774330 RepID=UPI0019366501|nr:diacylglycerol kinase family lipid kinase [Aerococcaceae bacterium zg-1292]MBS4455607.1 diacylglycerol kinase family lipid kinase [Aerococcaceae bacterium zg-A91]MBS4457226.1 diacylglycerol kinase family lipid kinase [Aerococcaceae bacterium zg-BR33]QQA37783.1 diacylglycerol kinase family lipid kinase [Aerococcaceae bacterium zg-1292]
MLKQVLIIANPGSGKNMAETYAKQLQDTLESTYGATTTLRLTTKEGDATQWASKATAEGFDTVICLGGDGTVNETIQGVVNNDPQPSFGFVPLGTVNDLGRAIGYSLVPEEAIEQFKHVQETPLDVGFVNDKVFINVLAIGAIPESVMATESEDKNSLGAFAYVKDAVGAFFAQEGYPLLISHEHDVTAIETNLLVIALTNSVGGFETLFPDATIDDGLLHLVAVKGAKPYDLVKAVFERGITQEESDSLLVVSGKKFTIEVDPTSDYRKDIPTNIDGDSGPQLPLDITVKAGAIQVLKPK